MNESSLNDTGLHVWNRLWYPCHKACKHVNVTVLYTVVSIRCSASIYSNCNSIVLISSQQISIFKIMNISDAVIEAYDWQVLWYVKRKIVYWVQLNTVGWRKMLNSRLGDVTVCVLAIKPKVRWFKPSQGGWFLRAIKICSTLSFGGEVKSEASREILRHVKKALASVNKNTLQGQIHHSLCPFLLLATRWLCW
jgi:hypothetical protein